MGFMATCKLDARGLAAAKHHGAGYEGLELVPHYGSPGEPGAHAAVGIADASGYESDATVFSEGTLSDDEDDQASREGLLPETSRLLSDASPGARFELFFSYNTQGSGVSKPGTCEDNQVALQEVQGLSPAAVAAYIKPAYHPVRKL